MIKNIVLYNHVSGSGHHDSWTAMFAEILLERGFRVICMTPDKAALEAIFAAHELQSTQNLFVMSLPDTIPLPRTVFQKLKAFIKKNQCSTPGVNIGSVASKSPDGVPKIWKPTLYDRWRLNAHLYAKNSPQVGILPEMPTMLKIKRHILHLVVPPLWYISRLLFKPTIHTGDRYPPNLAIAAHAAVRDAPWQPEFMLCMYIDTWMTKPSVWRDDVFDMPVPWGGIRFVPFREDIAGSEGYMINHKFRGLCFLDEDAAKYYQKRLPEKVFEFIPDIANVAVPEGNSVLAEEILNLANGRKIVLLCGSIESRKNVKMFCELARIASPDQYFFAVVGQMHALTLNDEEAILLNSFMHAESKNTFFRDIYFDDERDMNVIVRAVDILFAVYRNFRISSNMLGKAASFEKPILVSDQHLMGRRVTAYGIGHVVSENDANKVLESLVDITQNPISLEKFRRYQLEFSREVLAEHLTGFIDKCMQEKLS